MRPTTSSYTSLPPATGPRTRTSATPRPPPARAGDSVSEKKYELPLDFFGEEERGAFAPALSGFGVVPVHPPLPLRGADPAPLGVPSRLSRLVARG